MTLRTTVFLLEQILFMWLALIAKLTQESLHPGMCGLWAASCKEGRL